MSMKERSGARDLLYSQWHRDSSVKRFLGARRAAQLMVIDIDWCEWCYACKRPLALIETQRGDRPSKPATVTSGLAQMAALPAFSVSYVPNEDGTDIERFHVRRLWPQATGDMHLSPAEYAEWLWSFRIEHEPDCRVLREVA